MNAVHFIHRDAGQRRTLSQASRMLQSESDGDSCRLAGWARELVARRRQHSEFFLAKVFGEGISTAHRKFCLSAMS